MNISQPKSNSQFKKIKNNSGFLLVEIILSISLFAIVVLGAVTGILYAQKAQVNAGANNRAVAIAEDSLEIIRNIRSTIFSSTVPNCSQENRCGLQRDNNTGAWSIVEGNGDDNSGFHRSVLIQPGNINGECGVSYNDITVEIWPNGVDKEPVSLSTQLTNWNILNNPFYTFSLAWGRNGSEDGNFSYPKGIIADSLGNIYVADSGNHRIEKFDSSGTFITKWGSYGSGDTQFINPSDVAIDSSDNVFVLDGGNRQVKEFDSSGTFITKWGSSGSGNGQFNNPKGITIDSSDNIYVADTDNNRIQEFDSSGTFITKWGGIWGYNNGQLKSPQGISVDYSNNIYVADLYNYRIQKFDSSGNYITQWGSGGSGDGQFNPVYDVTVDSLGNIYTVDGNNRIQKFDSSGNYITKFGENGSCNGQFSSPQGILVTPTGDLYISDTNNHRIQKFIPK